MDTTTKAALREMLSGRSRAFWGMVLLLGVADIAWDFYSPRGVVIDVIGLAVLLGAWGQPDLLPCVYVERESIRNHVPYDGGH